MRSFKVFNRLDSSRSSTLEDFRFSLMTLPLMWSYRRSELELSDEDDEDNDGSSPELYIRCHI